LTLYICRHGRTDANASGLLLGRADPELDPTGRIQAAQIAAAVPSSTLVITSPLQRCRQTAQAVVERSGAGTELVVDDRLLELDYGTLDLTPLADVPASTWTAWRADEHYRPEGGESLRELADRVGALLDDLTDRAAQETIALVTHVSPIKACLAWALDVPIGVSWRCYVEQASISVIDAGRFGPVLRRFNDVSHLDPTRYPSPEASGGEERRT
jgi:broad specificity phosphatase PhoE